MPCTRHKCVCPIRYKIMDSHSNQGEAKQAEQKMLEAIRSGKAKMQPRWHFVLQAVLFAVGGIIMLLMLLYLASFIMFMLQETGLWFAPDFGAAGWYSILRSLPWALVFLLAVFMIVLAVLVKRYSFVYKRPAVYLFTGIVAVAVVGGFLITRTSFHKSLFYSARHDDLPILGEFYRGFGMERFDDIHRGMIIEITTNGFVIQDDGGQTSTVIAGPRVYFSSGGVSGVGDDVVIFGERSSSGTITAGGIRFIGR